MDIKQLMQKMHEATTEEEKESVKDEIGEQFSFLSDSEKEEVRKEFLSSLDEKIEEAKETLERVDIFIEMSEISKYVSLSAIARNYFGKSKEWLYQRINGYMVNGKRAKFTDEEKKKLAEALKDISRQLNEVSLRIA